MKETPEGELGRSDNEICQQLHYFNLIRTFGPAGALPKLNIKRHQVSTLSFKLAKNSTCAQKLGEDQWWRNPLAFLTQGTYNFFQVSALLTSSIFYVMKKYYMIVWKCFILAHFVVDHFLKKFLLERLNRILTRNKRTGRIPLCKGTLIVLIYGLI